MYFLVYIPEATGGSGFGVFCIVVLAICLLIMAATFGYAWLLMPVAFVSEVTVRLNQWWWVLPALTTAAVVANFIICKVNDGWHPMVPYAAAWVLYLVYLVVAIATGSTANEPWYMYPLLLLGGFLVTFILYPIAWALMTVTALPVGFMQKEYMFGAVCAFLGLVFGVFALQGFVQMVVGWFGESQLLDMVKLHYEFLLPVVSKENTQGLALEAAFSRAADAIGVIPAWLRFLICTPLCVLCSIGEGKNSVGNVF